MIKILIRLFKDEYGGLGITRASLVSAIAESTGAEGTDDAMKIRRLINQRGTSFCNIADWPFLHSDISFSISTADGYKYSGASYLPATFKRVTAAFLLDGTDRYPLTEVGILEANFARSEGWPNPDDNTGRPDEFCITRIESGYWEIQFNRKPDNTYTVYLELELQWTDLTADSSETLITKEYYDAFVLYCNIARSQQQGDTENYQLFKDDWWNPLKPQDSMLTKCLKLFNKPTGTPAVQVDMEMCGLEEKPHKSDYSKEKA